MDAHFQERHPDAGAPSSSRLALACWDINGQSDSEVVRMIRGGADVNCSAFCGLSPLWYAASGDRPSLIPLLLEAGARVDFRGGRKLNTALHEAARQGHLGCVQVSLSSQD